MAEKTLYDALELSATASPEAIHAAYQRLSAKFDPDRPENAANPGAKMQHDAVKEAFISLGNPEKRKQYDDRLAQLRTALENVKVVKPFWTLPKLIVLGVALVAAAGFYYGNQKEQARLARVEAERQIAVAKAKEAAVKARAEREMARIEVQQIRQEQFTQERAQRAEENERRRLSIELRSKDSEASREKLAAERERKKIEALERRAEAERRKEETRAQTAARLQAARDKAELCRIERERYGKALSC